MGQNRDVDEEGLEQERTPAEIGRDDADESALGQERESALEPREGAVRPEPQDD